jgi:hypothetical protein
VQSSGLHLATEESVNLFVNVNGAFEIGEMSAVFQGGHPGIRNCLRDVLRRRGGDEFVVARR